MNSSVRHLPPKKQSSIAHRDSLSDQSYRTSPAPLNDFSQSSSRLFFLVDDILIHFFITGPSTPRQFNDDFYSRSPSTNSVSLGK